MSHTSVGFIVSRGVGNAVIRHRVTRQLRHLMRTRHPDVPAGTGVVVRALPTAAGRTSTDLALSLDWALDRALDRTPSRVLSRGTNRGRDQSSRAGRTNPVEAAPS